MRIGGARIDEAGTGRVRQNRTGAELRGRDWGGTVRCGQARRGAIRYGKAWIGRIGQVWKART